MRLLARMKPLRGSWADIFGYTRERRHERQFAQDYRLWVATAVQKIKTDKATALAIAALPDAVRGFGPVKAAAMTAAYAEYERLSQAATQQNKAAA